MPKSSLSKIETEAVSELLNTSLSGSAAVLSSLLSEQVFVTAPTLTSTHRSEVLASAAAPVYVVLGEYSGAADGMQLLSISKREVDATAGITGLADTEEEQQFQLLQKMVGTMFESVAQSMSALLEMEISHSLSGMDTVEQLEDFPLANFTKEQWFVEAKFELNISGKQ